MNANAQQIVFECFRAPVSAIQQEFDQFLRQNSLQNHLHQNLRELEVNNIIEVIIIQKSGYLK